MTLTYRDRGTSGTQLNRAPAAPSLSALFGRRGERWEWSWNMSKGPLGFSIHGHADTKPKTQAMLESEWQAWLDAAGLSETR